MEVFKRRTALRRGLSNRLARSPKDMVAETSISNPTHMRNSKQQPSHRPGLRIGSMRLKTRRVPVAGLVGEN